MVNLQHVPGAGSEPALTSPSPAMAAALAQIGREFGPGLGHRMLKGRARAALKAGTLHPAVQARYRGRAEMLRGCRLNNAIVLVETWHREERKAFQVMSAFAARPRLPLMVLEECRLLLRYLRRRGWAGAFPSLIGDLLGDSINFDAMVEEIQQIMGADPMPWERAP